MNWLNIERTDMKERAHKIRYWGITIARGLCLLLAAAAGFLAFLTAGDSEIWAVSLFFATICLLSLWFAFRGHIPRHRVLIVSSAKSGIILGLLAWCGGIGWALYRWPGSNMAPIIGYIFTGPLGFTVGAVLGILRDFYSSIGKILRWIARVSSVLYLVLFLFLLVSSLMGEVREYTMTLTEKPSYGCVFAYFAGLLLAWRNEVLGGLIAICSTVAFAAVLRDAPNPMHMAMLAPAVLFILAHLLSRHMRR